MASNCEHFAKGASRQPGQWAAPHHQRRDVPWPARIASCHHAMKLWTVWHQLNASRSEWKWYNLSWNIQSNYWLWLIVTHLSDSCKVESVNKCRPYLSPSQTALGCQNGSLQWELLLETLAQHINALHNISLLSSLSFHHQSWQISLKVYFASIVCTCLHQSHPRSSIDLFCNQSTFWSFLVTVTASHPPRQSLVRKRKCGKLCDTRPPVIFPAAVQLNYTCDYAQLLNLPRRIRKSSGYSRSFLSLCMLSNTDRSHTFRVRLQQNKDRRT